MIMDRFDAFINNNYYTPLDAEDYIAKFDEWLNNNPDVGQDFGVSVGEEFALDVAKAAGLSDDEFYKMEFLPDFCAYIYEYMLHRKHYEYLVRTLANHIIEQTAYDTRSDTDPSH